MESGKRRKNRPYNYRRYWYHVSTTLEKKHERLIPWGERRGFNRTADEPAGNRICVAPTVEQCITAIPYTLCSILTIYRTKKQLKARKAHGIFDSRITKEGWIEKPASFVKVGIIKFEDVEEALGVEHVIEQSASSGEPRLSGKVLKWWKRAKIRRFIKRA